MKNKYGLFGLLALLGFIGIFTDSTEFIGFFCFAYFFRYLTIDPDEMFIENIRSAATWAFFAGSAVTVVIVLAHELLRIDSPIDSMTMGSSTGWCLSVITFVAATAFLDWKEGRGLEND